MEFREEHVFENMQEFYDFLLPTTLENLEPRLATFYAAFEGIGKGCKCNKKKKIEHAKMAYIDIKNINDGTQYALKNALNVAVIIFKQDNQEIFRFDQDT